MTELADTARAVVILSDFANADPASKVNLLGASWLITGIQPSGLTPAQTVVVLIDVLASFYGESFAISLTLVDDVGEPVQFPGQPTMRIQQLAKAERPNVPGVHLPPDLPGKVQMIMQFPNGLSLQPGHLYKWRLEIDGNSRPEWEAPFYVVGQPPQPVIG